MAGNFLGMVFSALQDAGIDASKMSNDQAVEAFNNIVNKGKAPKGFNGGTPAENKALADKGIAPSQEEIDTARSKVETMKPADKKPRSFAERVIDKYIPDYTGANEKYELARAKKQREYQEAKEDFNRRYGKYDNQGTPAEQERIKQMGLEDKEEKPVNKFAKGQV